MGDESENTDSGTRPLQTWSPIDRTKDEKSSATGDRAPVATPPIIVESTANEAGIGMDYPGFGYPSDFSVIAAVDGIGSGSGMMAASYEGPLPPPTYLKGYEDLVPGAATKIISWVQDESEHRRELERAESKHRIQLENRESEHRMQLEDKGMQLADQALGWGIFRANLGMLLAWPLVMGIVGSGTFLIYNGHDTAGTILVESGLALVGGGFLLQRIERFMKPRENERTPKDETKDHNSDEDKKPE